MTCRQSPVSSNVGQTELTDDRQSRPDIFFGKVKGERTRREIEIFILHE